MSSDEIEVKDEFAAQVKIEPENHQRRGGSDSHTDGMDIRDAVSTIEACAIKRRREKRAMASRRYRQREKALKPPKPPAKTAAERCKAYRERQKLLRYAAAEAATPILISSKKSKIIPSSTQHAGQIHDQHSLPIQRNILPNSTRLQQNSPLKNKQKSFDIDVHDNRDPPNKESQNDLDSDMDTEEHSDRSATEFDEIFVPPYRGYMNHRFAHKQFQKMFVENPFGYACSVCDRLWFKKDLKKATSAEATLLKKITALTNVADAKLCSTCKRSMQKKKVPKLSTFNGFRYPEKPAHLPQLNIITERLISPRLPFMQIRRLRHVKGQSGITAQIINVPVSVDNMVNVLPRNMDDDFSINVHIKKKLIHKSSHLQGFVKKNEIQSWLDYLVTQPMYKFYDITIDNSLLADLEQDTQIDYTPGQKSSNATVDNDDAVSLQMLDDGSTRLVVNVNELSEHIPIEESILAQQQTLVWNDNEFLQIAAGENNLPKSFLFDKHAEELSFPSIYLGQMRDFRPDVSVTPFMIASSELRRSDRRGVTPNKLLYVAAKIMRLRISESLKITFKYIDTNTSKETITSPDYMKKCLDRNLAFLKPIPNSAPYWSEHKRNLFAMMRQLGKPTISLTMRANEIGWIKLLQTLHYLKEHIKLTEEQIKNLNYFEKTTLINEDAVTCVLHFDKLLNVIFAILQSKKCSPFGKYRVINFFKRIEFQHQDSPHVHSLLWLDNAPKDPLGADYEATVSLIDTLFSVSSVKASNNIELQIHKHTSSCYKKNRPNQSPTCCFDPPFMPMRETVILTPLEKGHPKFQELRNYYKLIRKNLEDIDYDSIDHFYDCNEISSDEQYVSIIRAGIMKPRVFVKRIPSEKWNDFFNPFLLNVLASTMDFQYILDEYSCAQYVAEYVNKTNRGISDLQQQIIQVIDEHPDFGIVEALRKLSVNVLNSVEMTSQEAAWFLLRLPMSKMSVAVVYIPTIWPEERERIRKTNKELEELGYDSTDIWKENWFDEYQKRPEELEDVTLAQFVSKYNVGQRGKIAERKIPRILRYRNYDMAEDLVDYKREMVTLHLKFRDEAIDVLADMKFLQLFEDNQTLILERRKEFESGLDIAKAMEKCAQICRDEPLDNEGRNEVNPRQESPYKQRIQRIGGDQLRRSVKLYELTEVMRQERELFSSALRRIGNGGILNTQQLELIESRFVTKEDAHNLCPDAVRLFFDNHSADVYNLSVLNSCENKKDSTADDEVLGCDNDFEKERTARAKLHQLSSIDTGGLPYQIVFALDKPYIITTDIDVPDGLANGAVGKLVHVEVDDQSHKVIRVWLLFPKGVGEQTRSKTGPYAAQLGISNEATPISRTSTTFPLHKPKSHGTLQAKRNHFPLEPACAMTIQKSQAGTYPSVVYTYSRKHPQSLVHVALSRVTSPEALYIVPAGKQMIFHHGRREDTSIAQLRNKFERLSTVHLKTIDKVLLEKIEKGDVTIFSFNCHSINKHSTDSRGHVLQESDILMLSETWLNDDEHVNVQHFDCVVQFKRPGVRAHGVDAYQDVDTLQHVVVKYSELHTRNHEFVSNHTSSVGDLCVTECSLVNGKKIILVSIYVSPDTPITDIKDFIQHVLLPYTEVGSRLLKKNYHEIPMIVSGDFNVNFATNESLELLYFCKDTLNLDIVYDGNSITSRHGTTIDAVFARFVDDLSADVYISHFSYYNPIITILGNNVSQSDN